MARWFTNSENGSTRVLPRFESLANELRNQIVIGQFTPGKQMPTLQQIEKSFNVSRSVAQLAVERLKQDGFVQARSRQGLFVTPNPPHLKRYGLLFPFRQTDPLWSRFHEALVKESQRIEQTGDGRQFGIFAGIDDMLEGANILGQLEREIQTHRLAGLITLVCPSSISSHSWLLTNAQLPKVYVLSAEHKPSVLADGASLINRSLEWLKSKGRSRIAVLHMAGSYSALTESVFSQKGLQYYPRWHQRVGRSHPEVVDNLIPLLMDYPEHERPDGLFIADDNLAEYTTSAVVKMGLRVGIDLDIVAHCNWPWPVPCVLPIQRIGFHAGQMLQKCIEVIDAQRSGKSFDISPVIPALFEDEVESVRLGGLLQA